VVACQDFAQLEEVHGKEGTRALIAMCGTLMVGRIGPGETAETLSKNLGTREVERSNVSTSFDGKAGSSSPTTTLTYSRDSLALYVPAELAARLGDKPLLGGCVFAVAVQGKTYEILWPYFAIRKVREAHVPALWTIGLPSGQMPASNPLPVDCGATGIRGTSAVAGTETSGADGLPEPVLPRVSETGPGTHQVAVAKFGDVSATDLNLSAMGADVVDVSASPPASAKSGTGVTGNADVEEGEAGFDAIEAVSELATSHDPAETAAHLALQAVEMLKPKPGPRQKVQPRVRQTVAQPIAPQSAPSFAASKASAKRRR
jgi:hypothetical protein